MVHNVYYTQRIHRLRTVSENTTLSLVESGVATAYTTAPYILMLLFTKIYKT